MIVRRGFASYDEYVYQQGGKARGRREKLLKDMPGNVRAFERVFGRVRDQLPKGPVLCLGARTGAEMIAAERCGFHSSVGIDLHPVGPKVRQGDWHSMPEFLDGSFPTVYTNSFDHCLLLEKACAEILRILPAAGVFYLMASDKGLKDQAAAERWKESKKHNEAIFWSHSNELRDAVLACGFRQLSAWRDGCWGHYLLGRAKAQAPAEASS